MLRARLPSIFCTSHKMPRLPRNLHPVATWRSPANAICNKNTQQDTSNVLRLPRQMTMDTSKVLRLPRKLQRILWKRCKSIAPATQNDFRRVTKKRLNSTKCHACHAKRSNETFETSKNDSFCRTYHRHGHTALTRKRLRTVANVNATSSEHTLNPQTPRVKREPLPRIREKLEGQGMSKKKWNVEKPTSPLFLKMKNQGTKD